MERAKKQVDRYKSIRTLLTGDFYPLTRCSLSDPWIGYQFHRTDLNKEWLSYSGVPPRPVAVPGGRETQRQTARPGPGRRI